MNNNKFLQISLNRSHQVRDLALATANGINVGIVIVSETNRLAIRNRSDWILDRELDAGMKTPAIWLFTEQWTGFAFVSLQK